MMMFIIMISNYYHHIEFCFVCSPLHDSYVANFIFNDITYTNYYFYSI